MFVFTRFIVFGCVLCDVCLCGTVAISCCVGEGETRGVRTGGRAAADWALGAQSACDGTGRPAAACRCRPVTYTWTYYGRYVNKQWIQHSSFDQTNLDIRKTSYFMKFTISWKKDLNVMNCYINKINNTSNPHKINPLCDKFANSNDVIS